MRRETAFSRRHVVSPDGAGFRGVTDAVLEQAGLARRVVLSVPHFLFMIAVLESSDLVAMLPARLAAGRVSRRLAEPPLPVAGYEMAMYWHERSHRDPAHRWLREQIAGPV